MQTRAKITPTGELSLPAEIRRRYGLTQGGELLIEDRGDAIVLTTTAHAIERAQAMSRELLAGRNDGGVADLLARRRREADSE